MCVWVAGWVGACVRVDVDACLCMCMYGSQNLSWSFYESSNRWLKY